MRPITASAFRTAAAVAFLGLLLPVVLAHGDDEAMDMGDATGAAADEPMPNSDLPPSYFSHSEHRRLLVAHIGLMIIAWVFILPLGK